MKNIDDINKITMEFINKYDPKNKYIIVTSAFYNETNKLIDITNNYPNSNDFEKAKLISIGEVFSSTLLSISLSKYINVKSLTSKDIELKTTDEPFNSKIKSINKELLDKYINEFDCLIIAGFQGINTKNEITTLGRNGSDLTAIYLSYIYNTDCILYKDNVLYQLNPNINKSNYHKNISYDELLKLLLYNNPIISKDALLFAKKHNIKIIIHDYNSKLTTTVSNTSSNLNLLGIVPIKSKLLIINNISNKKIINFLNHLKYQNISITNNRIELILTDILKTKLYILFLLDKNINLEIKEINTFKYIYKDKEKIGDLYEK